MYTGRAAVVFDTWRGGPACAELVDGAESESESDELVDTGRVAVVFGT